MTTAAENEFKYRAEVIRCWACAQTQKATHSYTSKNDGAFGVMSHITRAPEGGG